MKYLVMLFCIVAITLPLTGCSYNPSAANSITDGTARTITGPFRWVFQLLELPGFQRYTKCSNSEWNEDEQLHEFLVVNSNLVGLNLDQACALYGVIAGFADASDREGDRRRLQRMNDTRIGHRISLKVEQQGIELDSLKLVESRLLIDNERHRVRVVAARR